MYVFYNSKVKSFKSIKNKIITFVCLRTHMYNCTRYALANKISVQYVYIHKAKAILDNGVVRLDKWKDYLGIVI